MKYDFSRRERDLRRIVFSLMLDRKRMTERIVIARSDEVRQRLERGTGDAYYDEIRPLGSLLISLESDKTGEWNKNAAILRESYEKVMPLSSVRWNLAASAGDYLSRKSEIGEPSALFAAIRTWEEYLNCFNLNYGANLLMDRLAKLYKPFMIYADYRPWRDEPADVLARATQDGESAVELWYPAGKRVMESVVASVSLLPIIAYYLNRVAEWKFVFQRCKVCGKHFLARSRHYELCSDECRKVQSVEAKRDFDARTKGDRIEQLYEAAYQYWYNRLRKLRKGKAADPEKAAVFKDAFDTFRREAVRRKAEVKRGNMMLAAFASWLAVQQNEADMLMEC